MFTKPVEIIKRAFIKSLTYRSEIVVWLVLDCIPLLILLLVWVSVYQNTTTIHNYSLVDIFQYYLLGMIINGLTASHFEQWRVRDIREGKIDFSLTRPLSYLQEIWWTDVGGKLFYVCCMFPTYFIFFWLVSWFQPLGFDQLSLPGLIPFMFLIGITYIIQFLLALFIVLMGFWFEGAEGLEHFKWMLITLGSGSMIPLAFMPNWLRQTVNWLPFQYMYAVPVNIIQGRAQLTLLDVAYVGGFVLFLLGLVVITWRQAQYAYSSQGG